MPLVSYCSITVLLGISLKVCTKLLTICTLFLHRCPTTTMKPHTGFCPPPASAHMHYLCFHGWGFSSTVCSPFSFCSFAYHPPLRTLPLNPLTDANLAWKHCLYLYFVTSWWLRTTGGYCDTKALVLSGLFDQQRKLMVCNSYSCV